MAGCIQLEDHARIRSATVDSRPVEVAGRVADHTCARECPVRWSFEIVQYDLRGLRRRYRNSRQPDANTEQAKFNGSCGFQVRSPRCEYTPDAGEPSTVSRLAC